MCFSNKTKLFLLLLISLLCISSFDHAYHASITNIELDTEERLAKISVQLFTDDLYTLFEKRFGTSPNKLANLSSTETLLLKEYLKDKIQLSTNRKPTAITYLGLEEDQNFTTLYLEGKIVKNTERIEIKNSILTAIFPDQINTIHVTLNNVTKSVHLTTTKLKGLLFFNSEKE